MFEATFIQGTFFRQIIEALKDLVTDVNIECTSNGMKAQAMDPSHIGLAYFKISTNAFDSYRCDRSLVIGLNITNVLKVLKCMESNDSLSISTSDSSDTVNFCITSKKQDRVSNFELRLINLDPETLSIPHEPADTEVTLPSSKFSQLLRDLTNFSDTVLIKTCKNSIDFTAEGTLGTANISIKPHEFDKDDADDTKDAANTSIHIQCSEPIDVSYSIKFLLYSTKAQSLSKDVTIYLSKSQPLCVEYKLNESNWGSFKYYLAPKLQDDEADE